MLPEPEQSWRGQRVYVRELAAYLGHDPRDLRRYARERGLLHRSAGYPRSHVLFWVSAETATRLIAMVRAKQGAVYLGGRDYHREKEQIRMRALRQKARRAAANEAARLARVCSPTEEESG